MVQLCQTYVDHTPGHGGFSIVARGDVTGAILEQRRGQWGLRVTKDGKEILRLYSPSKVSFAEVLQKAQAVLEELFPQAAEKVWWRYTYRGGYGYTEQIAALVLARHAQKAQVVVYELRSQQLQHKNARLDLLTPRTEPSILDEKWAEAQARWPGPPRERRGT